MYIYNITIIILQLANHQTKNMEILGDQLIIIIIIIIIKDNTCEKNKKVKSKKKKNKTIVNIGFPDG